MPLIRDGYAVSDAYYKSSQKWLEVDIETHPTV